MLYPKTKTLFKPKPVEGSRKWDYSTGEILADTAALHFLPLEDLVLTEKIDGTNMSLELDREYAEIVMVNKKNGACKFVWNRGIMKILDNNDKFHVEMANKLFNVFKTMHNTSREILKGTTFFGELCGPKIQKGGIYFPERRFLVFDIFDTKTGKFFTWGAVEHFCEELGLETVPVIDYKTWYEKSFNLSRKLIIDGRLEFPCVHSQPLSANNIKIYLKQLKSVYNPEHQAEGMVIRYKKDTSLKKRWVAKIRHSDFLKEDKK